MVLATSAKDDEVDLMLDALGAGDAIDTAVSSGVVSKTKPEPDIIEAALDESATDRSRAVMVGDTRWDVIAAQRAGIPCIGLLTGGIAAQERRDAGAAEVYDDAAALLKQLSDSVIGRLERS
ncbi:MAG: HAD family hydrolase [Streptosporangiaceae bacterium]